MIQDQDSHFCPRGTSRPRPWSRGLHHWKYSRLRDKTDRAWFSRLLRHLARKCSVSILTTPEPAQGQYRVNLLCLLHSEFTCNMTAAWRAVRANDFDDARRLRVRYPRTHDWISTIRDSLEAERRCRLHTADTSLIHRYTHTHTHTHPRINDWISTEIHSRPSVDVSYTLLTPLWYITTLTHTYTQSIVQTCMSACVSSEVSHSQQYRPVCRHVSAVKCHTVNSTDLYVSMCQQWLVKRDRLRQQPTLLHWVNIEVEVETNRNSVHHPSTSLTVHCTHTHTHTHIHTHMYIYGQNTYIDRRIHEWLPCGQGVQSPLHLQLFLVS